MTTGTVTNRAVRRLVRRQLRNLEVHRRVIDGVVQVEAYQNQERCLYKLDYNVNIGTVT